MIGQTLARLFRLRRPAPVERILHRDWSHAASLHYLREDRRRREGEVYKAQDSHLDRFVAIKVLPRERFGEESKSRFIQEAKAASALNHPNIVTVYDIASEDDVTFIAMEYVPGKTLEELIPPGGLPLRKALGYASKVASGLARAHESGIVHRDLKPANVIWLSGGVHRRSCSTKM